MEKLNLPITEGYPSRNAETVGLLREQFGKSPRFSRWYDMHTDKKDSGRFTVCSWSLELAKLNSALSRIARHSLPSAPPSRAISQDILRHWERAARKQTVMCNQAVGLSRCLTKVQDTMVTQLKTLHMDKGKECSKLLTSWIFGDFQPVYRPSHDSAFFWPLSQEDQSLSPLCFK